MLLSNGKVLFAGGSSAFRASAVLDSAELFHPQTMQFESVSNFDLYPEKHPLRGRFFLYAGGEHDPPVGPDVELHSSRVFDVARNQFVDFFTASERKATIGYLLSERSLVSESWQVEVWN